MTPEERKTIEDEIKNIVESIKLNIIETNKLTSNFNKNIKKIKEYLLEESKKVQNLENLNSTNNQLNNIDKDIKKNNLLYLSINKNLESKTYFPYDSYNLIYKEEIGIRLEQKWTEKPQNIDSVYF